MSNISITHFPAMQDLEHRRRADPSNDITRALALKAAAAKVSGAAAAGMIAGPSGGEAVVMAKGEDKNALLQRLRQQVCAFFLCRGFAVVRWCLCNY